MDRSDQQVKGSLVIPRSDGSTSFTDFTDNAASGTNRGLEASINWRATEALRFSGFIARLNASFDRYVNIDGTDLSGRDQPQAPADQYRLSATYDFSANLSASLDASGRDAFFLSDRHEVTHPCAFNQRQHRLATWRGQSRCGAAICKIRPPLPVDLALWQRPSERLRPEPYTLGSRWWRMVRYKFGDKL